MFISQFLCQIEIFIATLIEDHVIKKATKMISEEERMNLSKRAIRISFSINLLLALTKGIVGLVISSIALLADSFDSSLDIISSIVTFFGVTLSSKPPDEEHPYGHGKYEMLFTLGISFILFVSSGLIIHGALDRLASNAVYEFYPSGVVIACVGIIGKVILSQYLLSVGSRVKSTVIIADAYNNRTDSLSTLGVLIAIVGIYFGHFWMDPVIAIGITLLIIYTGISISKVALATLLDLRPSQTILIRIRSIAANIEGIQEIHKLRARQMGADILADVHILVNNDLTIEQGHRIAEELEMRVKAEIPVQELLIHIEPAS